MKRRNADCGKLRRPVKRNSKIAEGMYGRYMKCDIKKTIYKELKNCFHLNICVMGYAPKCQMYSKDNQYLNGL